MKTAIVSGLIAIAVSFIPAASLASENREVRPTLRTIERSFPRASEEDLTALSPVLEMVKQSYYQKCKVPNFEKLGERTGTNPNGWMKVGKCKASYYGKVVPNFCVRKDEMVVVPHNPVRQIGYCGTMWANEILMRWRNSKATFFLKGDPYKVSPDRLAEYFAGDEGEWSFNSAKEHHEYEGPYQLFFVPAGYVVFAYNVVWTTNYLVGADHFIVMPAWSLVWFGRPEL